MIGKKFRIKCAKDAFFRFKDGREIDITDGLIVEVVSGKALIDSAPLKKGDVTGMPEMQHWTEIVEGCTEGYLSGNSGLKWL
ncbi:hypothetical protein LCGC14_0469620 [marine sediment metagenome]|uniref:Uncharacterized protein n=1 Tax=marine sediment metagenome TaxID=412755 RepID=A0A0F9SVD8_9ZZZZ